MKFLDKVYWFWMRNWLGTFLIIKRNFCFEILWKYFYLIKHFLLIKKPEFYQKLGWRTWKNLEENTIITNGFINLVGIFYSYQTIWIALVRPPFGGYCYLNHACIVIYLCPHWLSDLKSKWSFLIRSTGFGWGTG